MSSTLSRTTLGINKTLCSSKTSSSLPTPSRVPIRVTHRRPSSVVANTAPREWPYSPKASIIVRSWNTGPLEPLAVAGFDEELGFEEVDEDDVAVGVAEDDAGSIAMSSKDVDSISSRRALASLMTVFET